MKLRSLSTIIVYWFALIAGLVLFTATRPDVADVAGLWVGIVGGTALGQFLAARDLRLWFVVVVLAAFAILCGPFTPRDNGTLFWMAMIPATLCGWMSLSERGSLLAFWLPVVVWMLTILDRGNGALALESGSAALLGGLAFVFIAFLFARETRRIALWRNVAPTPIAMPGPTVVLREVPRLRVGVAGWSLVVSSAAFAICAWLAPRLWRVEALVPEIHATEVAGPVCCHERYLQREQRQARVKEYFDLGRGHDDLDEAPESVTDACVVCGPDNLPLDARRYVMCDGDDCGPTLVGVGGHAGGDGTYGTPGDRSAGDLPTPPADTPPADTPAAPPEPTPPAPSPPGPTPEIAAAPPPEIAAAPPPEIAAAPPPEIAAVPSPEIAPAPPPARPPVPTQSTAPVARAAPATPADPSILTWVVVVLASGLAFQVLVIGLRPLRRSITLRHLRDPFWSETVDQRISNYWHLVLVGLRDAGWRTTSAEAPRELAKRLDIESVERAAAILERARHGVGIDATDLADMREASEAAYRASRARTSAFARILGWFRRPLV